MKFKLQLLVAIAGLALLGLAGCSKTDSGAKVDTSKVESEFSSVPASDKTDVEKAIASVKAGDFASAATSLQAAASNVKLTPAQQQALKDLLAQVQAQIGNAASKTVDAAKKVGEDASKAATDATKALTK